MMTFSEPAKKRISQASIKWIVCALKRGWFAKYLDSHWNGAHQCTDSVAKIDVFLTKSVSFSRSLWIEKNRTDRSASDKQWELGVNHSWRYKFFRNSRNEHQKSWTKSSAKKQVESQKKSIKNHNWRAPKKKGHLNIQEDNS